MKIFSCILLLCAFCTGFAQTPEWISYTTGSQVNCLASDGQTLWIGTEGGLFKMNIATGQRELFTKTNSDLPDNRIQAIYLEANGDKWIGTGFREEGGGVAKLSGQTWTIYNTANSGLPSNSVNGISKQSNGTLWFSTYSGGVASFDGTDWTAHVAGGDAKLPMNSIRGISINAADAVTAISEWGFVSTLDDTTWTTLSLRDELGQITIVNSTFTAANGTLWIGSRIGLLHYDGSTITVYNTDNSGLPSNDITAITEDANGAIWVATGKNIVQYNGTWTTYNSGNSALPDDNFIALASDTAGNVWAGSVANGFAQFDGTSWTNYTTTGLPNHNVVDFVQDTSGTIWMATRASGIISFDGTTFTQYNNFPANTMLTDLLLDTDNHLWVGTTRGAAKFDGTNWTYYNSQNTGLPGDTVYALSRDAAGNIYLATGGAWINRGGIAKYNGSTWTFLTGQNSGMPADNNVNLVDALKVVTDASNNIWVATYYGLLKYNGSQWTHFKTNNGLPSNSISALAASGNNIIVGTTAGLARYNGSVFTVDTALNNFLPGKYVSSITVDGSELWIGTNKGVAHIDGSNREAFTPANSGLAAEFIHAIMVDADNRKWIGTTRGVSNYRMGGTFLYVPIETDGGDTTSNNDTTTNNDTISTHVENFVHGGNASLSPIAFPNPAQNDVTLFINFPEQYRSAPATMVIYNFLGISQLQTSFAAASEISKTKINLQSLSAGVYFYEIHSGGARLTGSFSVIR
jgi:ligand-binding sensor domain-containing protein